MVLVYMTAIKEHKKDKSEGRCAVYSNIFLSWAEGSEQLNCYQRGGRGICTLRELSEVIPKIPMRETQRITFYVDDHALSWDFALLEKGQVPEFYSKTAWSAFISTLVMNHVPISHISMKEEGMMTPSERDRAMLVLSQSSYDFENAK